MKSAFCSVLLLMISVSTRLGHCNEPLTRDLLKSLPVASSRGLVPVLEVEWSKFPIDQFALMIQFQTSHRHSYLFNPFGESSAGRPYQVILTDSEWNPVYQVTKISPAHHSIPHSRAWIDADNNRIIGRRFWRNRDWTLASNEVEPQPDSAKLAEGNYLLHLLVTERLETEPPFGEGFVRDVDAQALWRTDELDRFACRSQPVSIQVGADGRILRPASEPPHPDHESPIRITSKIEKQEITIQAILITDKEYQCANPGLRGSLFDTGIHVKPPVQDVRYFMNHSLMGQDDATGFEGYRRVPKDAILGIQRRYLGPLDTGAYEISVAFPSNMWLDRDVDPAVSKKTTQFIVSEEQILK